ncbi:MAG TPA: hypothetical protein VHV30_16370 [Polyangiaceae bacterium]|jgi:hypothetical protein|nr:hypothetical protein [Polyangiaceae bacterium]
MKTPALLLAAMAPLLASSASCSKKDDATSLAPAASSLAVSKADSPAASWHYVIDPKSSTHVDMPGVKEHIKADTTVADGSLDVDPTDLTKSRGVVRIDLTSFASHTFGNGDDPTQTKHALTWLEVAVDGKTSDEMRWAVFAIRSAAPLDGAPAVRTPEQSEGPDRSPPVDLTKVAPVKDGPDDVRQVPMTVHGEVLVHGHKVEKDGVVDVAFRYPSGAAPDSRPTRIEIKSKEPMRLVLKELDVRPRDPAGQLLDWTTKLISKVAEIADVTVDLAAVPAPAPATAAAGTP